MQSELHEVFLGQGREVVEPVFSISKRFNFFIRQTQAVHDLPLVLGAIRFSSHFTLLSCNQLSTLEHCEYNLIEAEFKNKTFRFVFGNRISVWFCSNFFHKFRELWRVAEIFHFSLQLVGTSLKLKISLLNTELNAQVSLKGVTLIGIPVQ